MNDETHTVYEIIDDAYNASGAVRGMLAVMVQAGIERNDAGQDEHEALCGILEIAKRTEELLHSIIEHHIDDLPGNPYEESEKEHDEGEESS